MYENLNLYNPYNSLYHSGILGMKWGVRRFQNEDGTLTEAGKLRYGKYSDLSKDEKKAADKVARAQQQGYRAQGDAARSLGNVVRRFSVKDPEKSPAKKMSDDDLKKAINRMNMERQYNQLTGNDTYQGAEFAAKLLDSAADVAIVGSSAATLYWVWRATH